MSENTKQKIILKIISEIEYFLNTHKTKKHFLVHN